MWGEGQFLACMLIGILQLTVWHWQLGYYLTNSTNAKVPGLSEQQEM